MHIFGNTYLEAYRGRVARISHTFYTYFHNLYVASNLKKTLFKELRLLTLPFKLIYRAHIFLVLYITIISTLMYFLIERGSFYLRYYLFTMVNELDLKATVFNSITPYLHYLFYLVGIPVFITAIVLPVKLTWKHERLRLWELLLETPKAIGKCGKTLLISARIGFLFLVPGFAVVFLYFAYMRGVESKSLSFIYLSVCALVCFVVTVRALPIFLSPLISLYFPIPPQQAVFFSRSFFHKKTKELWLIIVFVALIGVLGYQGLEYGLHHSGYFYYAKSVLLAFLLWYLFTSFSIVTLHALIEEQQAVLAANQVKQQPQPVHTAQAANSGYIENPVRVEVQRVWVRD